MAAHIRDSSSACQALFMRVFLRFHEGASPVPGLPVCLDQGLESAQGADGALWERWVRHCGVLQSYWSFQKLGWWHESSQGHCEPEELRDFKSCMYTVIFV